MSCVGRWSAGNFDECRTRRGVWTFSEPCTLTAAQVEEECSDLLARRVLREVEHQSLDRAMR